MEMIDWLIFIGPFECFQKRRKNRIFFFGPLCHKATESDDYRSHYTRILWANCSSFSRYISRKFGYTCLQQMRASWLAVSSTAWLSCRNSREKRLKRHLRYYYPQLVRRRARRRSFVRLLSAELEFVYCKKSISIQGTSYAFCKQ